MILFLKQKLVNCTAAANATSCIYTGFPRVQRAAQNLHQRLVTQSPNQATHLDNQLLKLSLIVSGEGSYLLLN